MEQGHEGWGLRPGATCPGAGPGSRGPAAEARGPGSELGATPRAYVKIFARLVLEKKSYLGPQNKHKGQHTGSGAGSASRAPGLPGSGWPAGEGCHGAAHRVKNGVRRRYESRHLIFHMSRGQ